MRPPPPQPTKKSPVALLNELIQRRFKPSSEKGGLIEWNIETAPDISQNFIANLRIPLIGYEVLGEPHLGIRQAQRDTASRALEDLKEYVINETIPTANGKLQEMHNEKPVCIPVVKQEYNTNGDTIMRGNSRMETTFLKGKKKKKTVTQDAEMILPFQLITHKKTTKNGNTHVPNDDTFIKQRRLSYPMSPIRSQDQEQCFNSLASVAEDSDPPANENQLHSCLNYRRASVSVPSSTTRQSGQHIQSTHSFCVPFMFRSPEANLLPIPSFSVSIPETSNKEATMSHFFHEPSCTLSKIGNNNISYLPTTFCLCSQDLIKNQIGQRPDSSLLIDNSFNLIDKKIVSPSLSSEESESAQSYKTPLLPLLNPEVVNLVQNELSDSSIHIELLRKIFCQILNIPIHSNNPFRTLLQIFVHKYWRIISHAIPLQWSITHMISANKTNKYQAHLRIFINKDNSLVVQKTSSCLFDHIFTGKKCLTKAQAKETASINALHYLLTYITHNDAHLKQHSFLKSFKISHLNNQPLQNELYKEISDCNLSASIIVSQSNTIDDTLALPHSHNAVVCSVLNNLNPADSSKSQLNQFLQSVIRPTGQTHLWKYITDTRLSSLSSELIKTLPSKPINTPLYRCQIQFHDDIVNHTHRLTQGPLCMIGNWEISKRAAENSTASCVLHCFKTNIWTIQNKYIIENCLLSLNQVNNKIRSSNDLQYDDSAGSHITYNSTNIPIHTDHSQTTHPILEPQLTTSSPQCVSNHPIEPILHHDDYSLSDVLSNILPDHQLHELSFPKTEIYSDAPLDCVNHQQSDMVHSAMDWQGINLFLNVYTTDDVPTKDRRELLQSIGSMSTGLFGDVSEHTVFALDHVGDSHLRVTEMTQLLDSRIKEHFIDSALNTLNERAHNSSTVLSESFHLQRFEILNRLSSVLFPSHFSLSRKKFWSEKKNHIDWQIIVALIPHSSVHLQANTDVSLLLKTMIDKEQTVPIKPQTILTSLQPLDIRAYYHDDLGIYTMLMTANVHDAIVWGKEQLEQEKNQSLQLHDLKDPYGIASAYTENSQKSTTTTTPIMNCIQNSFSNFSFPDIICSRWLGQQFIQHCEVQTLRDLNLLS